jgi:cold shock CspA family protein
MRYQGRIVEWQQKRGFGFILPNGGGPKVFLHVSDFPNRGRAPSIGTLVTYELGTSGDGRVRAKSANVVGAPGRQGSSKQNVLIPAFASCLLLAAVIYVGWVRFSHPNSTIAASAYKILFAREALRPNSQFRCAPEKASCSAMTSCAEAFYHQERCQVAQMDGDGDGIPCERQWCN